MDAIASSIFAFKEIKGLIKKVELYTERNRCKDLFQEVVELTVKHDMSVANAVDSLKKPSKKPKVKKKIRSKKVENLVHQPRQTKLETKFRAAKGEKEQLEKNPYYKVTPVKKDMLSKTRGPSMRVNALRITRPIVVDEQED